MALGRRQGRSRSQQPRRSRRHLIIKGDGFSPVVDRASLFPALAKEELTAKYQDHAATFSVTSAEDR